MARQRPPNGHIPVCGIDPEKITAFARIMGKNNKTMLLHNYGMARCNGAEMNFSFR